MEGSALDRNLAPAPANRSPARKQLQPLSAFKRAFLVAAGTLSLGVGVMGIYLPVLPTTPFLLLAAACYARSSERLYRWLLAQPRLSRHLRLILEERALPRNVKLVSLVLAWAVLGGLAFFVVESLWAKALLLVLALAKTAILLRIPTLQR